MRRTVQPCIYIALITATCFLVSGCEKSAESSDDKPAIGAGAAVEPKTENTDKKADDEAQKLFDKDAKHKPCDILTTELAGKAFGVPAADLDTQSVGKMMCIHKWENADSTEELLTQLSMVRTHKSVESAKRYFASSTKNRSKEEMKELMDGVKKKAKEDEKIDTKAKKKAADSIMDSIGADAVSYKPVEGVGDEAAYDTTDAVVTVRVANLTYRATAYKGKSHQPPKTSDIEKLKAANREFRKKTFDQRLKNSVKLAKVVEDRLNSM